MGETGIKAETGARPETAREKTAGLVSDRKAEAAPGPRDRLRRLRVPSRPRIWFELVLIAVSYGIYSLIRNAAPERVTQAQHHARDVWHLESRLGLDFEHAVNHALAKIDWLIVPMNYYYATLHFLVTIAVLVWLFRSHPGRYGAARGALFATTAIALVGYYLYPLAPPRLITGGHFIDTSTVHHTWGSLAAEDTAAASMSNQYAAMPSMHIGWSVWCAIAVVTLARPLWLKVLGGLYPPATLLVIVATANHFWLDAVGGLVCVAFGFTVSRLWYGRWWHRLPRRVPGATGEPVLEGGLADVPRPGIPRPEDPR